MPSYKSRIKVRTKDSVLRSIFLRGYHKKINTILEKNAQAYNKKGYKILEIGTGDTGVGNKNQRIKYNRRALFKNAQFIATDIEMYEGVDEIADVTKLHYKKNSFDFILCENVLEHLFDFQQAINELHRVLRKNGTLFIVVPFFYPIHGSVEHDYFRFTENALKKMLTSFSSTTVYKILHLPVNTGLFRRLVRYYVVVSKK